MQNVTTPIHLTVGSSAGDLAVRSLGITRLAFPIPFAAAGGEVNAYLVDNPDGSVTLFDTALSIDSPSVGLREGMRIAGRRLDEVRRVVVSHGHVDHFGSARAISDEVHAPVHVHAKDATKVLPEPASSGRRAELGKYFLRLGAPLHAIERMGARYRGQEQATARLGQVAPLEAGMSFEFRAFSAVVVHTPGHTPGHIALHSQGARILLSADHLLARISPCPLIELDPDGRKSFRALVSYFDSLNRIEPLELDWVLPGHGEPFANHRQLISGLRGFYAKRQARLLEELSTGPRTPYELALAEFGPNREDELFLILSEIVGNLEVLENDGRVERIRGEACDRYRLP